MTIEQRIERLERHNRALRLANLGTLGLLVCAFLMAASLHQDGRESHFDSITVGRLVVEHERGVPAITLRAGGGHAVIQAQGRKGGAVRIEADRVGTLTTMNEIQRMLVHLHSDDGDGRVTTYHPTRSGYKKLVVLRSLNGKGQVDVYNPTGDWKPGVLRTEP
jgi:hypothetical protein